MKHLALPFAIPLRASILPCETILTQKKNAAPSQKDAAFSGSSSGVYELLKFHLYRQLLDLLGEPLAGDVQTPLDRADRASNSSLISWSERPWT